MWLRLCRRWFRECQGNKYFLMDAAKALCRPFRTGRPNCSVCLASITIFLLHIEFVLFESGALPFFRLKCYWNIPGRQFSWNCRTKVNLNCHAPINLIVIDSMRGKVQVGRWEGCLCLVQVDTERTHLAASVLERAGRRYTLTKDLATEDLGDFGGVPSRVISIDI